MEEVQQDMIKSAKALYKEYGNKGLTTEPPFKGVGTQSVSYTHLDVYKRQPLHPAGQPCPDPPDVRHPHELGHEVCGEA